MVLMISVLFNLATLVVTVVTASVSSILEQHFFANQNPASEWQPQQLAIETDIGR